MYLPNDLCPMKNKGVVMTTRKAFLCSNLLRFSFFFEVLNLIIPINYNRINSFPKSIGTIEQIPQISSNNTFL